MTIKKALIKHSILGILLLLITIAKCRADELPRLFMLQKGDHIAFLLPVSHAPTKTEGDKYFSNIVAKIFSKSTILYDESAAMQFLVGLAYFPCGTEANQLPENTKVRMQKKIEELSKYDSYKFEEDPNFVVNDFTKVMILLIGPINFDPKNPRPGTKLHTGQVTTVLNRKFKLKSTSIEDMRDLYFLYCDLTSQEKYETVEEIINAMGTNTHYNSAENDSLYRSAVECISQTTHQNLNCTDLVAPIADKFIRTERNKIWVKKIINISKQKGIPFYAFGYNHFLPDKYGPGLLNLLRDVGFSIKLIRTLNDIPPAIRHRQKALP